MKKTFLALLVLGMCACSSQTNSEEDKGTAIDSAMLVQRVADIYDVALSQYYEVESHGTAEPWLDVDDLFCSADWCSVVEQVNDFDEKSDDGMIGFFEADYWIMGQDWDKLSVSDVQITSMTETAATVKLNLHNCGSVTAVRLEMVKEDGKWKIDNFIDLTRDFDWKAGMKEYLSGK